MSCREHETCEIDRMPPLMKPREDKPAIIISVWAVDTASGGPEEGGWWYEVGELKFFEVFYSEWEAQVRQAELLQAYPYTGKRSSFGRDKEDYNVVTTRDGKIPHSYFPLVTPHYE